MLIVAAVAAPAAAKNVDLVTLPKRDSVQLSGLERWQALYHARPPQNSRGSPFSLPGATIRP